MLREVFKKDGQRGGYQGKYAPGCGHRYGKGIPLPSMQGPAHPRSKAIGTRRLHNGGGGLVYWLVKVAAPKDWRLEHRVLMEAALGRALSTSEHVHHLNGDTLDNRLANLVVLSRREHAAHHAGKRVPKGQWTPLRDACIDCGETDRPHASRGRCTRCYQRHRRRLT